MTIESKKNCGYLFKNWGFTLLEVMIAVSIFGFLIIYVSQVTHMEIRLFNTFSKQSDLDHNNRAAMMHIIDEIRLNPNTEKLDPNTEMPLYNQLTPPPPVKKYYYAGDVLDNNMNSGVYYNYYLDTLDPSSQVTCCLINVQPSETWLQQLNNASLTGPVIYLDNTNKLMYRDVDNNDKLISDQIESIVLTTGQLESNDLVLNIDTLLKIEVTAVDKSKLISWVRLY